MKTKPTEEDHEELSDILRRSMALNRHLHMRLSGLYGKSAKFVRKSEKVVDIQRHLLSEMEKQMFRDIPGTANPNCYYPGTSK